VHYVTYISHRMHKQKFSIMYLGALFVESVPVLPEHKKMYINVSRPRRTKMPYVTHRSHWMQKHKFDITCLGALFVESVWFLPEQEK
jgi:hypothetical protein